MADTKNKITVCLTTRSNDLFFKRAIHSIKSQTIQPLEVILVINGVSNPKEGSQPQDIISSKFFKNDLHQIIPKEWVIVWTEVSEDSMANAKNLAMHYARGDWLLMLDGEDFLLPSCIEFYTKHLETTDADIIAEFQIASLTHFNFQVTKNIPTDKFVWTESVRQASKMMYTSSWKKGDLPLNIIFIRNEGKKYHPLDYSSQIERVLLLHYLLEERKIALSDHLSYIINVYPGSEPPSSNSSYTRFKKMASNVHINSWTLKEKIFSKIVSDTILADPDLDYIEKTVSYLSFK